MRRLFSILGVFPFLTAVFLNTIVDLGHKIVIQNTIFKVYDGSEQIILTAIVNALILLPFILMFSMAGYLTDKYAKHSVMKSAAWAAVGLTIGIAICYSQGWFWASFALTFLLAIQSAIYSPAKYAYIKALFGEQNLSQANGLVQAVSIIGILSGTLIFSILFERYFPDNALQKTEIISQLVPIGYILIFTSIFEVIMMYRIPKLDHRKLQQSSIPRCLDKPRLGHASLRSVLNNRVILRSIIGLSIFWSIGQVMLAAFPSFAKQQTGETNTIVIQAILAATGIGIAIGSMIAARLSRNHIETALVPVGAAGVSIGLLILPGLTDQLWMGLDFLFIGTMGGLLIVPLNALIQFHAGSDQIGRVLAANNLIQNLSMLLFLSITVLFSLARLDSQHLLILVAMVAVFGFGYSLYKLPQSLVRFILSKLFAVRYRVRIQGTKNLPAQGGVLLLGNHISWLDWAIIQMSSSRPVRFVMIQSIYQRWYLNWFFKLFGCIPIEPGPSSRQSLQLITELLNNGEVVCLFPEGTISRDGQLSEFKHGYEKAVQSADSSVIIVPFHLHGLWGSRFSRATKKIKQQCKTGLRRDLIVSFGEEMELDTNADSLKQRVYDLATQADRDTISRKRINGFESEYGQRCYPHSTDLAASRSYD